MYDQLKTFWQQFQSGTLHVNASGVDRYSRKELTRQLADVLDELTRK
jgi:hypothetical protein